VALAGEVDFHHSIPIEHRDVLDHTTRRPPRKRDDLETLSVQMDRVDVVRGVAVVSRSGREQPGKTLESAAKPPALSEARRSIVIPDPF
jgi:hypothetical protein